MIKIENIEVVGWEHALRGMRNPKNSWEKSDSEPGCENSFGGYVICRECAAEPFCNKKKGYIVGFEDLDLCNRLVKGGPVHAKYRRMITVYLDVVAPLYWWKEYDTYKVGTVANSCSTMHKIQEKEFTLDDFSHEHLFRDNILRVHNNGDWRDINNVQWLLFTIDILNENRKAFIETGDKKYWWQMIQLLPSSYNQRRTLMLNYEVLANIYRWRKDHKLDEWKDFCKWIETLPYSEIITGVKKKGE